MFNLFRHKEKEESRTLEGRIISDEEMKEMIQPKHGTFIKKEMEEIHDMMDEVKKYVD